MKKRNINECKIHGMLMFSSDDINSTSKFRGEVAEEFGAVIRALWCGQYRSIAMWDLKVWLSIYNLFLNTNILFNPPIGNII